ncbi:Rv2993c-like domain-containing protein [Azospirillum sp. INR13]
MRIARCTDGGAPFWAVVDGTGDTVRPFLGPSPNGRPP